MSLSAEDALTVKELIEELEKMPQDAKVITEGCDCFGPAAGVELDASDNEVLIGRRKRG